jgi:hypothetical protein
MCPECKKRFSETAKSCPKCGFVLDETIRQNIKVKTIRNNRLGLTVLACVILLFSGPCMIAPCMEHRGHTIVIRTQEEANRHFQQGQIDNTDVEAMAHGDVIRHVSPEEEEKASWSFFWLACIVLVLPAAGILVYLYLTKQEAPNED